MHWVFVRNQSGYSMSLTRSSLIPLVNTLDCKFSIEPLLLQLSVRYNIEQKRTSLLSRGKSSRRKVTAICAAPFENLVAICEDRSVEPYESRQDENTDGLLISLQLSIYHVPTKRRMRVMYYDDVHLKEGFTGCTFSTDSKYLITHGGSDVSHLVYWKWESEKMEAVAKFQGSTLR